VRLPVTRGVLRLPSFTIVCALAAIAFFEGRLRPLTRNRRRPKKTRPERFTPIGPEAADGIGEHLEGTPRQS